MTPCPPCPLKLLASQIWFLTVALEPKHQHLLVLQPLSTCLLMGLEGELEKLLGPAVIATWVANLLYSFEIVLAVRFFSTYRATRDAKLLRVAVGALLTLNTVSMASNCAAVYYVRGTADPPQNPLSLEAYQSLFRILYYIGDNSSPFRVNSGRSRYSWS